MSDRYDDNLENHMVLPQAEQAPEPDEDALYEEDRQRRIDESARKHDAAFKQWFAIHLPVRMQDMDSDVVSLMQSAFFGGAQYGADSMERIYQEVMHGLGQAQAE